MIAIQKEIIRDENGDPKFVNIPYSQFCALMEELGQPEESLTWSPEKLGEAAAQLVKETDPTKAAILREKMIAGFYGEVYAEN